MNKKLLLCALLISSTLSNSLFPSYWSKMVGIAKYGSLFLGTATASAASYLHGKGELYKKEHSYTVVEGQAKHNSNPQFYAPSSDRKSWEVNQTTKYILNIPYITKGKIFEYTKPVGHICYQLQDTPDITVIDFDANTMHIPQTIPGLARINSLQVNSVSCKDRHLFIKILASKAIEDAENNKCTKIRTLIHDYCTDETLTQLGFKENPKNLYLEKDLTEPTLD